MGRGRGRNTIHIPHGAWGSKHIWQVTPGLPVTCSKVVTVCTALSSTRICQERFPPPHGNTVAPGRTECVSMAACHTPARAQDGKLEAQMEGSVRGWGRSQV